MRIPSRAFVGVSVFGLITVLVTIPYTVLVLTGYQPAPEAPHVLLFPPEGAEWGQRLFLVLASLLSVTLFVAGWRSLVRGARQDARRRRRHEELRRQVREYQGQRQDGRPPRMN